MCINCCDYGKVIRVECMCCHVVRLYNVMSGELECCSVVCCTLVGQSVFSIMCSEFCLFCLCTS